MSRRYFPRFLAAGLLAAAVAPPGTAQWLDPRFTDVAPAPRPVGSWRVSVGHGLRIAVPPLSQSSATCTASAGEFQFLMEAVHSAPRGTAAPAPVAAPGQLSGTFYRELPGMVAALTFRGSDAKIVVNVNADGTTGTITLTAHVATTTDGTVHGVVTGADVDVGENPAAGMELAGIALELQQCVDQPFAFRARPSDGGLMVSGVKTAIPNLVPEMLAAFSGKYKPAPNGVVPAVKAANWTPQQGRCESALSTADALVPACPPYAQAATPRLVMPCPTPPPGVPADVGDAMVREFQKMLGAAGGQVQTGGMTLPSPRYLQHYPQYFAPDLAFPVPLELQGQLDPDGAARRGGRSVPPPVAYPTPVPCPPMPVGQPVPLQPPAYPVPVLPAGYAPPPPMPMVTPVRAVGGAPLGTWHRTVGTVKYAVAVKDSHLTMSIKTTGTAGAFTTTWGMVLTCDYHVSRDGSHLVGLVTGTDAIYEVKHEAGEVWDDHSKNEAVRLLTKLQKGLADKPFAVSFRAYDDGLVIGNVRFPACGDTEIDDLFTVLGGRYSTVSETTRPQPPKPTPASAQPVVPAKGVSPKAGGATSYAPDPNARIRQLLEQTQSPPRPEDAWRKLWFHQKPQDLTPVRLLTGVI